MANLPYENAYIFLHTPFPSNIYPSNVWQIVIFFYHDALRVDFIFFLFRWLSIIVFSFDNGAGSPGTDFSGSYTNAALTSSIVDSEPHYVSKTNVH